jgi:copper chaperone
MDAVHLTIEGMTCEHCVRAVERRLRGTPGIEVENVQIGSADVKYNADAMTIDEIADAIADEGYTAFVEK